MRLTIAIQLTFLLISFQSVKAFEGSEDHSRDRQFQGGENRGFRGQDGRGRQDSLGRQRRGGPCRQEIRKICQGVKRGQGRIKKCIEENISKLSPKCQEKAKKRKAKHAKRKACKEKIKAICGIKQKGERGHLRRCLKEKKDQFPSECRNLKKRRRNRRNGRRGQHGQFNRNRNDQGEFKGGRFQDQR